MKMRYSIAALALILVAIYLLATFSIVKGYYLYVLNLCLVNAIAAIGLMVISGVAGQMSLATSGLVAIGAYTTGILLTHTPLGFEFALVLGPLAAAAIGTLLAGPALRLSGLHLAIVTLAFGVIVVQLIGHGGWLTGGMNGLTFPEMSLFGMPLRSDRNRLVLIGIVTLVVLILTHNLLRFRAGRALLAIREREAVAQAMGVNVSRYKAFAFAYGSALAGLSGVLFSSLNGFISVDDFTIHFALYAFVMIAVGGMTSLWGALIGAFFVTLLPETLRGLKEASDLVFGVLLTIVIAALPGGFVSLPRLASTWLARRRGSASR